MGDITTSGEHLIISGDRIPVAAYQAIYHKLTSKVEQLNQVFPDAYLITINDIIQLNSMLQQSIVHYPVQSQSTTCSVSFYKHEMIRPSSFEKFRVFNFITNKPTSKISFQFGFFTSLPVEIEAAKEIVQRFKVSIIMDQDFVEEEDGVPLYMRANLSGNNISLLVEYSDYNVGRNLQVTVQDWVATLKAQTVPKWIKYLEKKSDFFSVIGPRIGLAAGFFGLSKWWSQPNSIFFLENMFLGLGWAVMMYIVSHMLIVEMYKQLSEARPLTFICLTNGDKQRSDKMRVTRHKKSIAAIALLSAFFVSLPINLFSNLLYDLFKG